MWTKTKKKRREINFNNTTQPEHADLSIWYGFVLTVPLPLHSIPPKIEEVLDWTAPTVLGCV